MLAAPLALSCDAPRCSSPVGGEAVEGGVASPGRSASVGACSAGGCGGGFQEGPSDFLHHRVGPWWQAEWPLPSRGLVVADAPSWGPRPPFRADGCEARGHLGVCHTVHGCCREAWGQGSLLLGALWRGPQGQGGGREGSRPVLAWELALAAVLEQGQDRGGGAPLASRCVPCHGAPGPTAPLDVLLAAGSLWTACPSADASGGAVP